MKGFLSKLKRTVRLVQMSRCRYLIDIPIRLFAGHNLRKLAVLYGSDKWNDHWYAQHYEMHFDRFRWKRLTLIEIGVGGYGDPGLGGGSLRMWRSYFPFARIHGIDIEDKSRHAGRRLEIHRGSQTDVGFLTDVLRKSGAPDLIIDDGSHRSQDVIRTFLFLFPLLRKGGFYAVEDTQTSYWPMIGGNSENFNDCRTTMGFFKALVDGLNWEEYFGEYSATELDVTIRAIHFYHNLVVVEKGDNREGSHNREWHQRLPEWLPSVRRQETPVH